MSIEKVDLMAGRNRAWYYRNAIIAFRSILEKFNYGKGDLRPYLDAVLDAAEKDPDFAMEMVEHYGERIRFCDWVHAKPRKGEKNGKVVKCKAYLLK